VVTCDDSRKELAQGSKVRKAHAAREGLKGRLDDKDIERVLKAMGSANLVKQERLLLKRKINICLELAGKNSQYHEYHIPHKVIEDCQRIRAALVALRAALREPPNVRYELAKEADRFPPCSSESRTHRRAIPCALAHEQVTEAERGVSQIDFWAMHRAAWAKERLGKTKQADYNRYRLILCLADIYTMIFGKPPRATRDGSWCLFLKEVLDISEGTSLKSGAVYDSWLKAKRWKTQVQGRPMSDDDFAWTWTSRPGHYSEELARDLGLLPEPQR
jgi:hypothetical protein